MKIREIKGDTERRVLRALITDTQVLARVAPIWKDGALRSKWSNIVASMCVDYFNRYERAPRRAIEPLFVAWATKINDDALVQPIEKFLASLSKDYTKRETNSKFLIDLAAQHLNALRLERLSRQVGALVESGDTSKALETVTSFGKIEMGVGVGVDVFTDRKAQDRAFAERARPLFTLKGAVGRFFGTSLVREGFLAFLAPEKRGKTWFLVNMAYHAMLQRLRVAFFVVGDESEEEMIHRFLIRAARHPLRKGRESIPTMVGVRKGEPHTDPRTVMFKRDLTASLARKRMGKVLRAKLHSDQSFLRMSVHASDALTVSQLNAILTDWNRGGWVPDVIVIDYPDNMAFEGGDRNNDFRQQTNVLWKRLRGTAQKWRALMLVATQANPDKNADGRPPVVLDRRHFTEDRRKLAHVTGMIGINQDEGLEKELGVFRLNWIVRRGAAYSSMTICSVAGCLGIGNPMMQSRFRGR